MFVRIASAELDQAFVTWFKYFIEFLECQKLGLLHLLFAKVSVDHVLDAHFEIIISLLELGVSEGVEVDQT